jgi:hypothetical protein
LAAAFTVLPAYANPNNPTVDQGKASFSTAGSELQHKEFKATPMQLQ